MSLEAYKAGFRTKIPGGEDEQESENKKAAASIVILDDSLTEQQIVLMCIQGSLEIGKNRRGLKQMNEDSISVYSNPEMALERLAQKDIVDVLVLDLNMPEMTGQEFLKRLMAMEKPKVRKVIISSSQSPDSHRRLLAEAEIIVRVANRPTEVEVVLKPINLKAFSQAFLMGLAEE